MAVRRVPGRYFLRRRADWRSNAGQALVEFALIAPIILIMLVGLWEVSRAWVAKEVLTDATRGGARIGAIASANPSIPMDSITKSIQVALASAAFDTTKASISITGFRSGPGNPVAVDVTYPYTFQIVGFLLRWTSQSANITLRARIVMRNE